VLTIEPLRTAPAPSSCRLCGGKLARSFALRVLEKYDVDYLRCANCDSLQTERPYWIQESYTSNLAVLDTGSGQRNIANLAAVYAVSRALHLNDVVDFGGGDGLLCRLLRDYGINCFVNDKYASATYARGFATPDFQHPGILLAFEVLEHFENPRSDLPILFESNPDVLLGSTAIYSGQGADWWYLTPESGQHLFFYSENALRLIAEYHDYSFLMCSGYFLFLKPGVAGAAQRRLISFALQRHMLRAISAAMRLLPTKGVWNDFNALRSVKK
jgi:hypothetical protein